MRVAMIMTEDRAEIIRARRVSRRISASDLDHAAWKTSTPVAIARYWSGREAPASRHAEARVIWTPDSLLVRFVCRQNEPLIVSRAPQTARKTIGLWERDVCEIFLSPDDAPVTRYFEFEAAPTGEWLDLSIRLDSRRPDQDRATDWEFAGGMTAAARVAEDLVVIAMRIPFAALGKSPSPGERWRANLFRCVGSGADRGYLAWQPTFTPLPDFHVPERFGLLRFEP